MKKIIITLSIILLVNYTKAQEVSVAKKMFGIEVGLIKADLFYEIKLDRKLTLRAEIGTELNSYNYKINDGESITETLIPPYLILEPRFYYGLDRRTRLKRNTANNSSNYISLKTGYFDSKNAFYNSNSNINMVPAAILVPSFGFRRSFAKNFSYEFAFGIGLQYNIYDKSEGCNCDRVTDYEDIQGKIGYMF